jgi:hypothetical protein
LIANLVEFPAVPKGAARIRMQVMANHSEADVTEAVRVLKIAKVDAEQELASLRQPVEGTERVPEFG